VRRAPPPDRPGEAPAAAEPRLGRPPALGMAVFGSVAAAVYRAAMADALPSALPAEALAAGRDSLFSAAAVARELTSGDAAVLLAAARKAFVAGLQGTAISGTALGGGLAVVPVTLLRRGPYGRGAGKRYRRPRPVTDETVKAGYP